MRILGGALLFFILGGISSPVFGQLFNLNPPTITGQRPTPLITEKNTSITIAFENLRVSDPDFLVPPYPQGYTLKVFPGNNYSLTNATVTPSNNFAGTLTVKVQVNDGKFNSNEFDLKIDVTNIKPVITSHESISIKEGSSFNLSLSHLKVADDDNKYPEDFRLSVYNGNNYTLVGTTVTPGPGFDGKLNVPVSVNDGHSESDKFIVTIEVKPNFIPVIKGQANLSVNQGRKITLQLEHFSVDDADNVYPNDFILKVNQGNNYTVSGNTVTPNATFTGTLKVPVRVNDGFDDSKQFDAKIEVIEIDNTPPEINGQEALITNEDQSITVTLANLKVTDPDNTYPDDFVLKIPASGANYSALGNRITPAANFNGTLTVNIRVNDGLDDSVPFPLSIVVTPINDPPVITGQDAISIRSGRSTPLQVSSLIVNDPDTENTSGFKLRILPGTNYTASDNVITPAAGHIGSLTVRVVVNDGVVDSAPFNLKVEVLPPSLAPLITGQQSIVMNEDASLTLKLEDLFVTDEDDPYPTGFTMTVHPGDHYTFQGRTITPELNKNGLISVNVTVNDGEDDSNIFSLKIYVIPVNDAPQIAQLETTAIAYEPGSDPMSITAEFISADIDNPYLSFAEVGFDSTFNALHDELIFENTDQIRGVYDATKGILSLIGQATLEQYDFAIRTIKYNYVLTLDEEGNQTEVLPGKKNIYFILSDGQLVSEKKERTIQIETSVDLDIPNTFTPNGDKANDTWRIRPVANASRFDRALIKVYTKKGLLIYESKGFEKGWDGSFNGEILPVDTYYYTIDLNLSYTKRTYKGTVMILR